MAQQVQPATEAPPQSYPRFTPAQRLEHILLLVSFTGLALTGLPQKYAMEPWARTMIGVMGGIESIRIVHRILATLLMALSIYHGGIITYKLFVLGRRATMIPGMRDLRDAIHWVAFNLGLRKSHPHLPRYNFGEKAEYLSVVWGTLVMVFTGFMLWNPIATASLLPGEVIPAARIAHGSEALLAVLAIITWHMYNVHIRRFNRSMFTGKLSREAMEEEHAEELEMIETGQLSPDPPPEVIAARRRVFVPYAVVMTILLVGGLIWFVSFERTALTTIPRQLSGREGLVTVSEDSGSAAEGEALWQTLPCRECHGEDARGTERAMNVSLAGTNITFTAFVDTVRRGPADMHPFSAQQISDEQLADLYAWLQLQER
jgi:cytochrome b subunit of formate dehydrogenase/cytochrome c553